MRNVVVFGKDDYWSTEATIDASGCRWPEFHWREAITTTIPKTLPVSVGAMLQMRTKTLLRYRFSRAEDTVEVTLIPNEYTLAEKPAVVWRGFVTILDDDSFEQVMKLALGQKHTVATKE